MTICNICRESTSILLDRRMKDSLEKFTFVPGEVCDKCKKKYLTKGVLLVEPETGSAAVLKNSAFKRVVNAKLPPKKIAFVETGLLKKIGVI